MLQDLPLSDAVKAFIASGPTLLFIGGVWTEPVSGEVFATADPSSGDTIMYSSAAGRQDVDRAVKAARAAFEGPWSLMTPSDRGRLLWTVADLLERDAHALAELETLDNGKPLALAKYDDLPMAIDHFRYFAGWATKLGGDTIPVSAGHHYFNYTLREPLGVVGQIIPWNYPLMLAAWKLAPALACGNCCILKPAEQTPLTAVWLGKLLQEAGIPDGVVNVLTGFGEDAGAAIAEHEGVDKVAFTGSGQVGRSVVRASVANLKQVSLELGGKSPNIVFADADVQAAIRGTAAGIFYNMGQDCAAGSRVLVEQAVYEEVADGLAQAARALRLGNGFGAGVDQGPLISEEQLSKVLSYIESGRQEGAQTATGGGRASVPGFGAGYFMEPTVFQGASNAMRISREEIFGPVVAVIPFTGLEDGVFQSNATRYGLGAGVWTENVKKAHLAARALKAGTVWINCYNVYDAASPFGGYKESGFGRELGRQVLDSYTQIKSVWMDLD